MKNVVGLGFCTDMPELYRAADFTIMASLYEPFGLVVSNPSYAAHASSSPKTWHVQRS